MPEQRRRFSPQFKAEAVQLVIETGKPIAEVARDLGIHAITVPRPTAFVARVTDENDAPLAGATVQSDEYTADVAGNARLWPGGPTYTLRAWVSYERFTPLTTNADGEVTVYAHPDQISRITVTYVLNGQTLVRHVDNVAMLPNGRIDVRPS